MPNGAYKFTRERKDAYLGHLRRGVGRCKAAVLVGINVKTVEREIAKGNGFIDERNAAEDYALDAVEESVFKDILSGNGNLGLKVLEVRRPEVWAPKKEPLPGSSPATPLHVAPGQIDWDTIPLDLAEEFLAVHAKIVALQPNSGGLVVDQDGEVVE